MIKFWIFWLIFDWEDSFVKFKLGSFCNLSIKRNGKIAWKHGPNGPLYTVCIPLFLTFYVINIRDFFLCQDANMPGPNGARKGCNSSKLALYQSFSTDWRGKLADHKILFLTILLGASETITWEKTFK